MRLSALGGKTSNFLFFCLSKSFISAQPFPTTGGEAGANHNGFLVAAESRAVAAW